MASLAVFVGWFWVSASRTTEVTTQSALDEFGGPAGMTTLRGPAVGVWSYSASGSETVGLGPFHVTRDQPATARIVIRPAAGGYWRTLALSEEHVEGTRMRRSPQGTRATQRHTMLRVAGLGRGDDTDLVPPPLIYPRTVSVGDRWTDRYRLREIDARATSRVTGRRVVTVAGRRVAVYEMRTDTVLSGAMQGTRNDEEWYAPSLGMPVRLVLDVDLRGPVTLREHVVMTLQSTTPAT